MSDIFRKMMDGEAGPGGLLCYCCNQLGGVFKPIPRRRVRRKLKLMDAKVVKEVVKEEAV